MEEKSIFWEPPYWEVLDVRHAIDVMHLTKNFCINLIAFLGVYGKTKDTVEVHQELQRMEERDALHPHPAILLARKRKKPCLTA